MPELPQSAVAMRPRRAEVRLAALATKQFGVVSRSQLHALGLDDAAIGRRLKAGGLHRLHPRVYAVGHRALELRGRLVAALLYAGPGAALAFQTAGHWWQLLTAEPRRIHVVSPHRRRSLPLVCVHQRPSPSRVVHRGLPVTPVERTLLDLAATLEFDLLRRAVAEADFRHLLDVGAVERQLGRGRPGAAALRKAVSTHLPDLARTRSELEGRFLLLCERAGLPLPAINEQVERLEVDAVWQSERVAVELDGFAAHSSPAQLGRDHRRDVRLRRAGYLVLRYSWSQLADEPSAVVGDLRAALSRS